MKKWFSSDVNNLDDLKKEYRKLCFKHHPDMGGSTEDMQTRQFHQFATWTRCSANVFYNTKNYTKYMFFLIKRHENVV